MASGRERELVVEEQQASVARELFRCVGDLGEGWGSVGRDGVWIATSSSSSTFRSRQFVVDLSSSCVLLRCDGVVRLAELTGRVFALVTHPHLPLLVSGSGGDNSVRVWDLETRALLHTLSGHRRIVFGLALDPAGRRVASGSFDRTVKLWDLDSGACLRTIEDRSMYFVRAVAWDSSGALVASGSSDSRVRIWDAASGALRHTLAGHSRQVNALAAHPTGDLLASACADCTVRIWRWSSGECVHTLEGHEGSVQSLVASASWLVSGSFDKSVRVWSWTSGECVRVLDGSEGLLNINSLSMRDSTLVTLEIDGTVRVWDASSADPRDWSCVGSLASKASSPRGVSVAALGGGCVACTAPGGHSTIAVWDVLVGPSSSPLVWVDPQSASVVQTGRFLF